MTIENVTMIISSALLSKLACEHHSSRCSSLREFNKEPTPNANLAVFDVIFLIEKKHMSLAQLLKQCKLCGLFKQT